MEKVTIGFSSSRKKFAIYCWLIKLVQGTKFSHVYLKWHSDSIDRDIIYQASGTMVNFMSPTHFVEHNYPVYEFEFEIEAETKIKMLQFAVDLAGVPYGLKACFGILIMKLCKIFGKKIKNPFSDGTKTEFCSELGATIAENFLKVKIGADLDFDDFGPGDLYQILLNDGYKPKEFPKP